MEDYVLTAPIRKKMYREGIFNWRTPFSSDVDHKGTFDRILRDFDDKKIYNFDSSSFTPLTYYINMPTGSSRDLTFENFM